MASDLTAVLQAAQSGDASIRGQAEQHLKAAEESNASSYLGSLAGELSNNEKPADTRQIAGILLKNALDAPGADAAKKVCDRLHQNQCPWAETAACVCEHESDILMVMLAGAADR